MDTRVLYIIAVIIASITGGYYYYSGKGKKLDANTAQSMTYSAKGIHLLQSDDHGQLHIRATVDSLEQDMRDQSSKLNNLNASMYKDNKVDTIFYANQGHGYNDNEKVILTGNVKATRLHPQGDMVIRTDELTGYPKLKTFETKHLVTVDSPTSHLVSNGLQANLNNGQYDFFNIRGKYAPH